MMRCGFKFWGRQRQETTTSVHRVRFHWQLQVEVLHDFKLYPSRDFKSSLIQVQVRPGPHWQA
eukprot:2049913-Rhodomonas_salina.2